MSSLTFWSPEYWLPRNISWSDVPSKFDDLIYPIYFAIPILILRILYESFVGITLGKWFGMFEGPLEPQIKHHLLGGFAQYTRTKKILETFYRFSSYSFLFAYGCWVLHDKPWLYDVKQCWISYPNHTVDNSIW
jgi:sphingoid base N-palmitoyltransferase